MKSNFDAPQPSATSAGRRQFLQFVAAASTGASMSRPARAAAFPDRPIRLVVGFPPGQSTDVIARAYAAALQQQLKANVFIDNRPGANGIIAAQFVKNAEPDGYTLLFGTSGQLVINPAVHAGLSYDIAKDFIPVAPIARGRLFLVVNKDLQVTGLEDLVAYSKAHPGKLSFGSGGIGITSHLAMEMLKSATGLDAVHIPFKGSPDALNALIAGNVQLLFDSGGSLLPFVDSGKVRAIAVSTKDRYAALPNVRTVSEQGAPGFEVYAWNAILAPSKTPVDLTKRLNAVFEAAGKSEVVATTLKAAAHDRLEMSQAELGPFIATETTRWAQAAAKAGIKPE